MPILDRFRRDDASRKKAEEIAKRRLAKKQREREIIEQAELRFNTYCIGVGRAGIHFLDAIYELDSTTEVYQIFPLALPSSRYDYQLADNLRDRKEHIFPFGASDRDVRYSGVGGDQHLGQQIALKDGRRILKKMDDEINMMERRVPIKAITLIGSLAGGTGGGAIPALAKMIKDNFPNQLLIVLGILPEKQEGNTFIANASRSYKMITNLRNALPNKYIDTFLLFENMIVRGTGMLQSYDFINERLAKTFNLLFGSSYSPDTLDPQDKLKILKKGGKEGIGLMCYTGNQKVEDPNPQASKDLDDATAQIIRILDKNLGDYPSGTVVTARFGAYQIRCSQEIFPFDVRNTLNSTFEARLQGGTAGKDAFVRGGVWPTPGSDTVEISTMILEVEPEKYDYLNRIMEKWSMWYEEEDVKRDFEQIYSTEVYV
jgi:cell division GTPase FtsZ